MLAPAFQCNGAPVGKFLAAMERADSAKFLIDNAPAISAIHHGLLSLVEEFANLGQFECGESVHSVIKPTFDSPAAQFP